LQTTGYFLSTWLADSLGERELPDARMRLIARMEQQKGLKA